MANVIQVKSLADVTGSNGGKNIPCWRFDGEPTAEQQVHCLENHISMEWANGQTREWEGMRKVDGSWNTSIARSHSRREPMGVEKLIYAYGAFMILAALIVLFLAR